MSDVNRRSFLTTVGAGVAGTAAYTSTVTSESFFNPSALRTSRRTIESCALTTG